MHGRKDPASITVTVAWTGKTKVIYRADNVEVRRNKQHVISCGTCNRLDCDYTNAVRLHLGLPVVRRERTADDEEPAFVELAGVRYRPERGTAVRQLDWDDPYAPETP